MRKIAINILLSSLSAVAWIASSPTIARAQTKLLQRCESDWTSPAQAETRLEWARKCALQNDVTNQAGVSVDGMGYDGNTSVVLLQWKEYKADNVTTNSFLTNGSPDGVNKLFRDNLYNTGFDRQFTDSWGYKIWRRDTKLVQPFFPTFGNSTNINTNTQLFPPNNLTVNSPCVLYTSQTTQTTATQTNTFFVNGYCLSGCYTPEQEVLFPEGYHRIDEAVQNLLPNVTTLSTDATLDKLEYQTNDVYSYTAEIRDTDHVIFDIETASGGRMRVTDEHPMIVSDGRVVQAKTLGVGDSLIQESGKVDPIVSVKTTRHFGKVYNLRPNTTDPITHVLVAQGYLVGSSHFQNDYIGYINRLIINQSSIPDDVLP